MNNSEARVEISKKLVERANKLASSNLSDLDSVALCLACLLPKDRNEIAGFMFSSQHTRSIKAHAEEIAISNGEFCDLFGKCSHLLSSDQIHAVVETREASAILKELEICLQCSLIEKTAKAAWARESTKLACIIGMHTDDAEEIISSLLGGLVRADLRRLDDMRCNIEDSDSDTLMLVKAVTALATTVTR